MGASSCFKGDAVGALDAWNALDSKGQKFIEYVCKRNDVTLPTGAPVPQHARRAFAASARLPSRD